MNLDNLLTILEYWSFWDKSPPETILRNVTLPHKLDSQLVLVVQGVRRCGKSTLLGQMIERYGLNKKHCLFLNFEDVRVLSELGPQLLTAANELFTKRFPNDEQLFFFFDEIQNVPNWEKWLHMKLERPGREHFIVSGSNSSMLSGELASKLTGRHKTIELYPFDFSESLNEITSLTPETYLTLGGFPKPLTSKGDIVLLQQYFRDIVERDIALRVGARNSEYVLNVIRMVFETSGSELSIRKIAGVTGLSSDTVGSYLQAAEDAYLIFGCPYFSYSARKQRVRNKKFYPIDPGLRRAVINLGQRDFGKDLELVSYIALRKKFGSVCYWRNNFEVDFIVTVKGQPLPIQVTWEEPKERHERGLKEFYENFPQAHEALFLGRKDVENNFSVLDRYY
jgi:uncharacterized protein